MKILVVVDSINIEDSSGSKANVAMIQNLASAGFEVSVYHYTLKNIQLSGILCFAIPEIKFSPYYFLSRTQRVLARNLGWNLMPFFEKIFGFSFTFFNDTNSIFKALKRSTFKPDLVITLSKGASFRPHYAVLKMPELHSKWLAYIHDPYPFHYYPQPYKWVQPGYKIKEAFFRSVSEKAKFSGFPSQLLKEWMGSYFSDFLKTGVIIPHQNTKYQIQDSSFPKYFDNAKFNILHAGNLLSARSPQGIIDGLKLFLKRCPQSKPHISLLFIGACTGYSEMLLNYKKEIAQLIVIDRNIDFDIVYHLQQNVSVNVILESKSEISPFLPAKFPHCVQANRVILSLSPHNSEVKRLLGKDYEYWAEVDDYEKIAELIEQMYFLWEEDPQNILLNRNDLQYYISENYIKNVINSLAFK
jgi:hypothetical protein